MFPTMHLEQQALEPKQLWVQEKDHADLLSIHELDSYLPEIFNEGTARMWVKTVKHEWRVVFTTKPPQNQHSDW